jgi:hypothetical protein
VFFAYGSRILGVAHYIGSVCDTVRRIIRLLHAPRRCSAATVWNHLELESCNRSNEFFAYGSRVLEVTHYIGTVCDTVRHIIRLLHALRRCSAATVWNHLELYVPMQNKWLCTNVSLVIRVA